MSSTCKGRALWPVRVSWGHCCRLVTQPVEMYSLPVPEAGGPGSMCRQEWFLPRPPLMGCRQPPSPCVFTQSSLLTRLGPGPPFL